MGDVQLTFGRCSLEIKPIQSVLLLEGFHGSYMQTPALGMDKVANIFHHTLPEGVKVYNVIVNYRDRNSVTSFRIDRGGQDASGEIGATDLHALIRCVAPGVIGVGGTSKEAGVLLDLLSRSGADLSRALVLAGGIHASVAPLSMLQHRALDMVILGRADETLPKALGLLQKGMTQDLLTLPHTAAFVRPKAGGAGFILADNEPVLEELNAWCNLFPDQQEYFNERRREVPTVSTQTLTIPRQSTSPDNGSSNRVRYTSSNPLEISLPQSSEQRLATWGDEIVVRAQTAEGCQYACSFCAVSALTLQGPGISAQRYIPYNLQTFATFLNSLAQDPRIQAVPQDKLLIYLEDAQVGGKPGSDYDRRSQELHSLLSAYPYRFGYQTRLDTFIETNKDGKRSIRYDLMNQLREGNVKYLFLSLESLDPGVLRRMSKGQDASLVEIYEVFKGLKERDIDYMISFIGGTENEPHGSSLRTAAFIAEILAPKNIAFEIAKVYPGTSDARTFMKRHGIDVADAYTTGNHTTSYSNLDLPPEERGCVLQSLSEGDAVKLHRQVSSVITRQGSLRNQFAQNFQPLGHANYEAISPGFFSLSKRP
jgi:hypothetical protein